MQISIVGGGLAGIMLHHELFKRGHTIDLYDKNPIQLEQGFGFALLPNGIHCLKKYGYWDQLEALGNPLHSVIFHNQLGEILKEIKTPGVIGFSRPDILTGLYNQSLEIKIQNCNLDYLTEKNNLQCPSGTFHPDRYDLILGSDGINSNVRKLINPKAYLTSSGTFEIVGQIESSEINSLLGNSFHKIVSKEPGLSIGLLPLINNKVIWYLQVDRKRHGNTTFLPQELIQFTNDKLEILHHPWIKKLQPLICNPIHLWDGKKMNHFDILAEGKYFLFGDAAHAFLPFTSQGANAALDDVDCFLDLLDQGLPLETLKLEYEKCRLPIIHQIAEDGIKYAEAFCSTPGNQMIHQEPIVWKKES